MDDAIIINGLYISAEKGRLVLYVEVPRVDGKVAWRKVHDGSLDCKCLWSGLLIRPNDIRKSTAFDPFECKETDDG